MDEFDAGRLPVRGWAGAIQLALKTQRDTNITLCMCIYSFSKYLLISWWRVRKPGTSVAGEIEVNRKNHPDIKLQSESSKEKGHFMSV